MYSGLSYDRGINYICSDILAVDIDKGLTLDAALDSEFVKNYAAIVYTTQNHSDDFHRFRIIFELEKTITSKEDMMHAASFMDQRIVILLLLETPFQMVSWKYL